VLLDVKTFFLTMRRWHLGEIASSQAAMAEAISRAIRNYRATGAIMSVPLWLTLKAEAFYFADHTSEALEALTSW
jgi:hypothetical protein